MAVPQTEARTYAAIVQDFKTGEVLHSRSADKPIYPASLTKMMTLYMLFDAIEHGKFTMSSALRVSKRAQGMPASKMWLKQGETIRVEDAIKALIVKSANDVAVVVAEALADSEIQFAIAMTEKARSLGMSKTTFKNASGLPNRRQKTTARDMATLATRLIRDFGKYYHYFALEKFTYRGKTYRSHNHVNASFQGADGLKTGYIRASGFNLASSASRQGRRIVAVVIGGRKAQTRDAEMIRLLKLGFERLPAVGLTVAIGPPVPKPHNDVLKIADAESDSNAAQVVPLAKPEVITAIAPVQTAKSASSIAELPVVHAPRRQNMVIAPNRPAAAAGTEMSVVLDQGPAKQKAKGRYGVQVGAYHDPGKARQHAVRVARKLPNILLKGDIDVSGLSRGRRTVYRSRVVGFEKSVAQLACAELRRIKQECLVIRTERLQLAASN